VIGPLNADQRRSVRLQLAGKEPVDESRRGTVLARALQDQKVSAQFALVFASLVLVSISTVLGADEGAPRYLAAFCGLGLVVIGVQTAVVHRRVGEFIEAESPA
jgi:hypothetical protein